MTGMSPQNLQHGCDIGMLWRTCYYRFAGRRGEGSSDCPAVHPAFVSSSQDE
jgi:hypothetical protein